MFNLKTMSDTTFQQLWAVSFPPWNATVFLPTVLRRWSTFFVLFQNLSSPQHMSRVTCRCVTVTLYQILPPSDFSPFAGITNPLNHSKNFFRIFTFFTNPTPLLSQKSIGFFCVNDSLFILTFGGVMRCFFFYDVGNLLLITFFA